MTTDQTSVKGCVAVGGLEKALANICIDSGLDIALCIFGDGSLRFSYCTLRYCEA